MVGALDKLYIGNQDAMVLKNKKKMSNATRLSYAHFKCDTINIHLKVESTSTIATTKKRLLDALQKPYDKWTITVFNEDKEVPDSATFDDLKIQNGHTFAFKLNSN